MQRVSTRREKAGRGQAVQVPKDPKAGGGAGEHRSRVQWPMKTLQAPGPGQLELPYRNAQTEVYFSEFWRPQAKVRCRQDQGLPRALCPACRRLPSRRAVSPLGCAVT